MTNEGVLYKPTTAFWKISKLLRNKSKEYVIQGGQGAGKTISILMLLIDYCHSNDEREVSILSDELSKMKKTIIRDFLKIIKDWNIYRKEYWNKTESVFTFPNGSFIEFVGLDVSDVGKGMRRHISYFNEVNKINEEGYSQVASRSNKVLMDFNPDAHFFAHELINDSNFISLTYQDNEFLSQSEVDSILEYKKRGHDEQGNIINQFWANKWRVYGLGEIGSVEGRIYEHFKKCTYSEFVKLNLPTFYGMDWGKNHPFAILQFKYDKYNNNLYCHELNYDSEVKLLSKMTDREKSLIGDKHGGIITYMAEKLSIPKDATIVCDSAVPDNILLLRQYGWEYAYGIDKPRGSVMAGITSVQSTNIYYTDCSKNIEFEQFNYSYRKDRKGVIDDEVEKINDDCFTAETLITTDKGDIKIIDVKAGDMVLTSNGYREVLHKFNNGLKLVKEYSLQFDTFSLSLNVTNNHLIKTDKEWKKISKLKSGMMVYHTRHLMEENTNYIQPEDISCNRNTICTTKYGNFIKGSVKRDFTYITRMVTRGIMKLKILKRLSALNILRNTQKIELRIIQNGLRNFNLKELKAQKNGISLKQELNSTENKLLSQVLVKKLMERENVKCVEKGLLQRKRTYKQYAQTSVSQKAEEIAESIMKLESVKYANQNLQSINIQKLKLVGVEVKNERYEETYDLMVEETHEFFANGILVHNCMDVIRYADRHAKKQL